MKQFTGMGKEKMGRGKKKKRLHWIAGQGKRKEAEKDSNKEGRELQIRMSAAEVSDKYTETPPKKVQGSQNWELLKKKKKRI